MDYIILFNSKLKAVSAPLRFICLLLPPVIYILIPEIVFLFMGLNVTLRGFIEKLNDGFKMYVLKLYITSVSTPSTRLVLARSQWIFKISVS